jgi:Na+-transporting NADH:ubiquinone oxidoreductase subunit NqrE
VWSDALQHAERLHLLRLCLWGALSTLAGTALLVIGYVRAGGSALIRRFASVCASFGAVELFAAAIACRAVPIRDIAGATRLDRGAWLQLGLFLGLIGIGVTLVLAWHVKKSRSSEAVESSLPTLGAGVAVALHGLALATLELLLIADISR